MASTLLATHKRGDTFDFTATLKDKTTGDPVSGVAENLACYGRYVEKGDIVATMTITETDTPGTYYFYCANTVTDDWISTRNVYFDIRYLVDGEENKTNTFYVTVEEAYTDD